jgi:hypothetical protein
MSRINFDDLARHRPEYGEALRALSSWFVNHPRLPFVPVEDVTREALNHSLISDRVEFAKQLTRLLAELHREGLAKVQFVVKNPDGVIVGDPYEAIEDIPYEVDDRFSSHQFRPREEGDITAVFTLPR